MERIQVFPPLCHSLKVLTELSQLLREVANIKQTFVLVIHFVAF